MNILVVGANGKTGRQIIKKLQETSQFIPIAGVRKSEQMEYFKTQGIEARLLDVKEKLSQIAKKLINTNALVFTAGGGGSSTLVDLDGKVKTMKAAEYAGIKRFLLISAGGIHHFHDDKRFDWMDNLEEYSAAMYYSDFWLQSSKLDYTIIRPGQLTNDKGNGLIQIGNYLPHIDIAREDVASTVVASLNNKQTIRKAFDVVGGTSPIPNELKKV